MSIRVVNRNDKWVMHLGLFSNEALRALEIAVQTFCINVFPEYMFEYDLLRGGFVRRLEDGELGLIIATYSIAYKGTLFLPVCRGDLSIFSAKRTNRSSGLKKYGAEHPEVRCGVKICTPSVCPHFVECLQEYWKDRMITVLTSCSKCSYEIRETLDVIVDEWSGVHREEYDKIKGIPLDPFRLASIAALKERLQAKDDMNIRKEYKKMIGAV